MFYRNKIYARFIPTQFMTRNITLATLTELDEVFAGAVKQ